jgi:hypothetical protein
MSSISIKYDSDSKIEKKFKASSHENGVSTSNPQSENNTSNDTLVELARNYNDTLPDGLAQARNWRFWIVFVALAMTGLLSALKGTIISTTLPTTVHNLDVGSAWIANAHFLTWSVENLLHLQDHRLYG